MRSLLVPAVVVGGVSVAPVCREAAGDEPVADKTPAVQEAHRGFRGGGGQGDDPQFVEDRRSFRVPLANRARIRRTITRLANGVETITESDDQGVAEGIRAHVALMHGSVAANRPPTTGVSAGSQRRQPE